MCLVDSACSKSIISKKLVRNFNVCKINKRVQMMDGSLSKCTKSCWSQIEVSSKTIVVDCLVMDILPKIDMLLGMDAIELLGGVVIKSPNDVEFVTKSKCLKREIVKSVNLNYGCVSKDKECNAEANREDKIEIEDVDFQAEFKKGKWTVDWNWNISQPEYKNSVSQYNVPLKAVEKFDAELEKWISQGWLQPYSGEVKVLLPLMAVIQENKD